MSLILKGLQSTASILRTTATVKVIPVRLIRSTLAQFDEQDDTEKRKPIDPLKDRSTVIPVETSIRYMQSKDITGRSSLIFSRSKPVGMGSTAVNLEFWAYGPTAPAADPLYLFMTRFKEQYLIHGTSSTGETTYGSSYSNRGGCRAQMEHKMSYDIVFDLPLFCTYKEAYGDHPVWLFYRRNHKGALPPKKTRKTCIRKSVISTGSPCPICRDEYLILDYRNVDLLKQFISEHTGEILSYTKTGICQTSYKKLLVAIYKAKEYGLITFDVPFRRYDYSQWYKTLKQSN